jgi:hypothetical protein
VVLGLGVPLLGQGPGEGAGRHPPLLVESVVELLVAKAAGLELMVLPGLQVDFRFGLGSLDWRRWCSFITVFGCTLPRTAHRDLAVGDQIPRCLRGSSDRAKLIHIHGQPYTVVGSGDLGPRGRRFPHLFVGSGILSRWGPSRSSLLWW